MTINIGLADILLVSPMIALFLASLIPLTVKVLRGNREQSPIITLSQALIGIVVSIGLLMVFGGAGKTAFNNGLIFDGVTQWMGAIALLAAGVSMIMMYENPTTKGKQFSELIFFAMSSAVGMLILVSAVDLLMVFIGLEMMPLSYMQV
jgi:NADH-quinone oxidoreductase subunit N